MSVMTLRDLRPGDQATVLRSGAGSEAGRRIAEMGITPGTVVRVERVAPLGDPIDVRVRGYHLGLRRDEAAILVESLQDTAEEVR